MSPHRRERYFTQEGHRTTGEMGVGRDGRVSICMCSLGERAGGVEGGKGVVLVDLTRQTCNGNNEHTTKTGADYIWLAGERHVCSGAALV